MKRNIPYLVLNSAALGIVVLGISGIAALMVGSVLVLSLVMLKLDKYIQSKRLISIVGPVRLVRPVRQSPRTEKKCFFSFSPCQTGIYGYN